MPEEQPKEPAEVKKIADNTKRYTEKDIQETIAFVFKFLKEKEELCICSCKDLNCVHLKAALKKFMQKKNENC